MNPLQQIPPAVRRWCYVGWSLLVVVQGATSAGYVAAEHSLPVWLIATGAVLLYIGGALGFTAASNAGDSRTVAVTAPENAPTTVTADVKFDGDPGRLGAQISDHLRDYKRQGGRE